MTELSKSARRLLTALDRRDSKTLYVGGIVECRAALELERQGEVRITEGNVTRDGGSGKIERVR
jgi:hypothetical protein